MPLDRGQKGPEWLRDGRRGLLHVHGNTHLEYHKKGESQSFQTDMLLCFFSEHMNVSSTTTTESAIPTASSSFMLPDQTEQSRRDPRGSASTPCSMTYAHRTCINDLRVLGKHE